MLVRTSFIGIGLAGALAAGIAAGFVRAHDSEPPSLGDTIMITTSPGTADGNGSGPRSPGTPRASGAPASPNPASSSAPASAAKPSAPVNAGGRAVPPPRSSGDYDEDDGASGEEDASGEEGSSNEDGASGEEDASGDDGADNDG